MRRPTASSSRPPASPGQAGERWSGRAIQRAAFIVSTGRTGTQAIARHLSAHYPDVHAVHEPRPSRVLRLLSNHHLAGRVSVRALSAAYVAARRVRLRRVRAPLYVESNPFLFGFLEALPRAFDRPLLVHVVRDPRSYVPSHLNHGALSGAKGLSAHLIPGWMIKPRAGRRPWRRMTPVERLAYRWRAINAALDRGASLYGERYLRVRFEDLFEEPAGGDGPAFADLVAHLSLPWRPELTGALRVRHNVSRRRRCPPWEEWSARDQRALLDECGPLMERYGYATKTPGRS